MQGYSDRINHALAFAAKHHDRQVHKGARAPYRTHAPNVAIILTRYGQPEMTVLAGILYDMVEDTVREGAAEEGLRERTDDKFGSDYLTVALAVVPRATDGEGFELSHEERRDDLLARLAIAGEPSRWVCAADALHEASSTLANLRRTIDPGSVWSGLPLGREATIAWYRRLHERLDGLGFTAPIMRELADTIADLERTG